jgi:putative ABC transport system substrate-binding protein
VKTLLLRAALATMLLAVLPLHLAIAQAPQKVYRLAILQLNTAEAVRISDAAFEQGLKDLGYVEGKNVIIERRYADGNADRLPALAAELMRAKPDVIFAPTTPAAHAAKDASSSIPIVISAASDPVGSGFAASLARPGGNVTGTSNIQTEVDARRLQMLKDMFPKLKRVALLHAGDRLAQLQLAAAQRGAKLLGVEIVSIEAQQPEEFKNGIAAARNRGIGAIMFVSNAQNSQHRQLILGLVAEHKLPAIAPDTGWIDVGALMSYGANPRLLRYRAATYVDKILRGAKPGDLPIEQPTKFELEINRNTAKALGITFPSSILARVDRVIE